MRSRAAAINDCTVQPLIYGLPFGGVSAPGKGSITVFRGYSNARGVLNDSTKFDLGIRYPPFDRYKLLPEITVPLVSSTQQGDR